MPISLMRILVVEDAVIAQIAEATVLESLDCHVDMANTGKEAIIKTNAAPDYDLIFMDLGLPDVDALTVTEYISKNYEQQNKKTPPIVALTAHPYASLQEDCVKAGMSDFIAKPLTEDVARNLLEKYAAKK